jgi:hypothetical protein
MLPNEGNTLSLRKRLAAVLATVAMAIIGLPLAPAVAAADPGPAARPWVGKGDAALVITGTMPVNRNGTTAQAQIFCGVQVFNFDPVEQAGLTTVDCHDAFDVPVSVPQITIRVTLAMDDGTARGPSASSSAINTPSHFEAAVLPICVPDRIGVVGEVTVVFPANTASGTFFSPNLVQNIC